MNKRRASRRKDELSLADIKASILQVTSEGIRRPFYLPIRLWRCKFNKAGCGWFFDGHVIGICDNDRARLMERIVTATYGAPTSHAPGEKLLGYDLRRV